MTTVLREIKEPLISYMLNRIFDKNHIVYESADFVRESDSRIFLESVELDEDKMNNSLEDGLEDFINQEYIKKCMQGRVIS